MKEIEAWEVICSVSGRLLPTKSTSTITFTTKHVCFAFTIVFLVGSGLYK